MRTHAEQAETQWLRLVEKALGEEPRQSLMSVLDTGATVEPLYTPALAGEEVRASGYPGLAPFVRGATGRPSSPRAWHVLQLLDISDAEQANAQARDDLANGADGLWLQLGGGLGVGGGALVADKASDFARVLSDVPLDRTPIYMSAGLDVHAAAALLFAAVRGRGTPLRDLSGSLGLDPLSAIAHAGEAPVDETHALASSTDAALYARGEAPGLLPFLASGRVWHQAGGSAVEELACTLAAGVAYWRVLADADVPLDEAAEMIGFHLTVDADVFLTITKFRAMRALWARVAEAAGIAPQPARISAEMSYRTMAARDVYTNLLRGTVAAFGAAAGGANAILLAPFTVASSVPDAFARRLARNTQIILAEESSLGRVVDAAGGSWYAERLTHDLAAQAWGVFQEIEAAGGLLAALKSGLIARRLASVRGRRDVEIARRERAITGVSTYPLLDETPASLATVEGAEMQERAPAERFDLPPAGGGERMAALVSAAEQGARMAGLRAALRELSEPFPPLPDPAQRDAQGFEELRAASDEAREVAGVRPSVFLANIGRLAAFTDRATFARNFFEAGGIAAIMGAGTDSIEALAQQFRDSGASIACLCGRDEGYAALAGAADALHEAGAQAVYIAGAPATLGALARHDLQFIQRLVHDDCDVLAILREAHELLRVGEVIGAARHRAADEAQTGWAQ